jgi:hypothetical protein
MQAVHEATGMVMDFPDGTPPEQIQQQFQQAELSMPTPNVSVAQQFMNGIQQQYAQQQAAPPPINGRGMIGLDPQQAQFMLQRRQQEQAMRQQSAIEQQRNRIQEQRMLQESIESEKDRSLRIKEFVSRLKNEQKTAKAKEDFEKWKMEQEAKGKAIEFDWDKEIEEVKSKYRKEEIAARTEGQMRAAAIRAASRGAGGSGGGGGGSSDPRVYDQTGRPYTIENGEIKYLAGYEPETKQTPAEKPPDRNLWVDQFLREQRRVDASEGREPGDPDYLSDEEVITNGHTRYDMIYRGGETFKSPVEAQPEAGLSMAQAAAIAIAKTKGIPYKVVNGEVYFQAPEEK